MRYKHEYMRLYPVPHLPPWRVGLTDEAITIRSVFKEGCHLCMNSEGRINVNRYSKIR